MNEFQNREPIFRRHRPLVFAFLLMFLVFVGAGTVRVWMRERELRAERVRLEVKVGEILQEQKNLTDQISELRSAGGVERFAKENLGLKQPGEEVVIVVPGNSSTSPPGAGATHWWDFFSRVFRAVTAFFR